MKTTRPRNSKSVSKYMALDRNGQKASVFAAARFYFRRAEAWLVLEIQHGDVSIVMSAAAAGVEPGFEDALLSKLEGRLQRGDAFDSRRMTATGEEISFEREYRWEDLFLDDETKSILISETTGFFERAESYSKMSIPHRRGVLLHGPPGTGKSLVGKILASTLTHTVLVWITAADVQDARNVRLIFNTARFSRRTVLFFEDLDLYASRRGMSRDVGALGELLVQLDGMRENNGLLVVATTNDLDAIEPALRERPSRFDRIIGLGPTSMAVRKRHLAHLLAAFGVDEAAIESLARQTEGMTGAQLQELAFRARMAAANRAETVIVDGDLRLALADAKAFRATTTVGFRSEPD